jgi:hypothetical protein
MSLLRGTLVPRIFLGIMGLLMLLLAWGSIQSLFTFGMSAEAVLVLVFAVPLAVICLSVATGWAGFHIGE